MLNNNNNHNSSCAFAEHIVAYLYDEATAKERNEFEIHLINCSDCVNEITGFGLIRSSISDWREEFFALETPVMEIPYLRQPHFIANQTVSTAKRSRLADFRNLFTLSPMWKSAAAAFATLVVCVGIALFVFVFSGNKELAVNSNQKIETPVSPSNSIENKSPDTVEIINQNQLSNPSPDSDLVESKLNNSIQNKRNSQENQVEKVANNASKPKMISPKSKNLAVRTVTNTNNETKTANTQKRQAPKLSDLSDEEDKKSLRLADLFDEIGTE